ncbi:MAG: YcgN family cysteine cluster protein [Cocleimonas sp.]
MEFWKQKSLTQMTRDEWESLCDHCGKCCLMKLEDEDDEGSIYYTNIVCELFDKNEGGCSDYANRDKLVATCLHLTQDNVEQVDWLPVSCAYRRILEGRDLAKWHHLVSGDKKTIHETGNSVLGRVVFEKDIDKNEIEEHIVTWPFE